MVAAGLTSTRIYNKIIYTALVVTSYDRISLAYAQHIARQDYAFNRLMSSTNRLISSRAPTKCFISYAWEKDSVENQKLHHRLLHLRARLEDINCQVFLDIVNMNRPPRVQMRDEINNADVVMLICTPRLIERLEESRIEETRARNAGLNPQDAELPAAFEFRLTKEKLLARPHHFRRIALHFSGDFTAAVPQEVSNIGATDIYGNRLTLDFSHFYSGSENGSLAAMHDTYKALSRNTRLIDQLHFFAAGDHHRHMQYGGYCNSYKHLRSTRPGIHHLNNFNDDAELTDDEEASRHLGL